MPIPISAHYCTKEQLESGLAFILQSPKNNGKLELIVARPADDKREIRPSAQLDFRDGMLGDNWKIRPFWGTKTGLPHPEMQLTLMNSRTIDLVANERTRWALAGDQLYVDLDLSSENLPAGSKLHIGTAVIEITHEPHTGCKKFAHRFGLDAMKFVNSPEGRRWNLRGVNAKIVQSGEIHVGDIVRKVTI